MGFSSKMSENFGKVFQTSPYTANEQIVKINQVKKGNNVIFGRKITSDNYDNLLFLGKIYENTIKDSLLGADAWLDTTFPHVIYITGTRGTGKSFDLGVILEGISSIENKSAIQNNVDPLTSIVIDTQSQFWTLGHEPNPSIPENLKQIDLLKKWNIEPNKLNKVKIFSPPNSNKFLDSEINLQIRPADVALEEWCGLFDQDVYSPQGYIISECLKELEGQNFELTDLINLIDDDTHWPRIPEQSRNSLTYKIGNYNNSGLFSASNGLNVRDLLNKEFCHILLLRDLKNEDKAFITAIIARQLFTILGTHHTKLKTDQFFNRGEYQSDLPNKVWLVIDEAHVVAPKDKYTPARDALIEYVKRGRDAGLSLVMATQQPSAIDDRILSQVNLAINHRLTFQTDINAATNRLPTMPLSSLKMSGQTITEFGSMIRLLESGESFVSDHGTSRSVMVTIRPRATAHGGYSPI